MDRLGIAEYSTFCPFSRVVADAKLSSTIQRTNCLEVSQQRSRNPKKHRFDRGTSGKLNCGYICNIQYHIGESEHESLILRSFLWFVACPVVLGEKRDILREVSWLSSNVAHVMTGRAPIISAEWC
jgi:hypothetical protein